MNPYKYQILLLKSEMSFKMFGYNYKYESFVSELINNLTG